MATWEDGPEYAPAVRPDDFSSAEAPPLEVAPPVPQLAAGAPEERPEFTSPSAPLTPLAALVPQVQEERDPQLPFHVATSALTSMDSAWGAAHGNPVGTEAGPSAPVPGWGSPAPTAWPTPADPLPPVGGPAQLPSGYPPPGTPQWFGPGPALPDRAPAPAPLDARAVIDAATPGLLICLAIGGFIYLFAPITLGVAFALSSRVKVAEQQVRQVFGIGWGFVALLAFARFLMDGSYGWWSFVGACSLVVSWLIVVAVLVLVYRRLRDRSGRPTPPYTSHWG